MAKDETTAFPTKRVRTIRPGYVGIRISSTEYVMPIGEADELVGMILRAKHEGEAANAE